MPAYYTPLPPTAPLTTETLNLRFQELDDALQNSLVWRSFNVKAYPFKARGDGIADDTRTLQDALDAAADWAVGSARGGRVEIPAGIYKHLKTLRLINAQRVCVQGTNAAWGSMQYGASVLKSAYDDAAGIDVTSTNDVTLEQLTLAGMGGTNLNARAVYGFSASKIRLYDLNIDYWGGAAIKIDMGFGKFLRGIQNTGCLMGFANLTERAGVVELRGTENYLDRCNFNGPGAVFKANTSGQYGKGYLIALYVAGAPVYTEGVVAAFAQHGVVLTGTSGPSTHIGLRSEFIQGDGIVVEGNRHTFIGPELFQVGLDRNDTYYGVKFSGANALLNCLVAPKLDAQSGVLNKARALLYDNVSSPHGLRGANRVIAPAFGFNNNSTINGWVHKTGTNPLLVEGGVPHHQTLVDAPTILINAALGDYWDVTVLGSRFMDAPSCGYKGQRVVLSIKNGTAGGVTTSFHRAFRLAGWVAPAPGKTRVLELECYDGTNWRLVSAMTGDLSL